MRSAITSLMLCLTFGSASADVVPPREDFLNVPDRIQWQAGALYDGRFEDGTRFQIQLAYPRPASLPKQVLPFSESYWYPKHFTGTVLPLRNTGHTPDTLRLAVQPDVRTPAAEDFTIVLAPDRLSGRGTWTSSTLHKRMAFTLQRAVLYDYVVVKRPAAVEVGPGAMNVAPERSFVFAASFPVLGDADADAWVREQAGKCSGDLECINEIQVRWKSRSLLSLNAAIWEYNEGAAHGNGGSTTRQYGMDAERMTALGFDAFVNMNAACASKVTASIVSQLKAAELSWPEQWAKNSPVQKQQLAFTPTASGIAFGFSPYEVGSYAQGSPSVFLTRAQLGSCLRSLPDAD